MRTKLEELYFDERSIMMSMRQSEEYYKIHKKYDDLFEELEEELTEEQKKKLHKLNDLVIDFEIAATCHNFKEGFKLAVHLIVEGLES